jgi:predicted Zn-dependent protease
LSSALVNGVGIAASGGDDGGQSAAMIAQAANQLINLRYGRKDEMESDQLGFKFMVEAGYDPRGILELMQILAKVGGGQRQPEMLSSHPDPGNRAADLTALIKQQFSQGIPKTLEDGRDRFAQYVRPR